ncbi:hypothetical protein CEXT_530481 [Caerostris extrusa]|uniref:Uncharacterized protein n=1 Tax=Caerostris extrusa TaxID=172846 RepID=A0AAV4TRB7_CAEEX|nr:hypothetical protein CEXT_530481 [Caerostris extrusa]
MSVNEAIWGVLNFKKGKIAYGLLKYLNFKKCHHQDPGDNYYPGHNSYFKGPHAWSDYIFAVVFNNEDLQMDSLKSTLSTLSWRTKKVG